MITMNKKIIVAVFVFAVCVIGLSVVRNGSRSGNAINQNAPEQEADISDAEEDGTTGEALETREDAEEESSEDSETEVPEPSEEEIAAVKEEYEQYIAEDGSVELPEELTEIANNAFAGQKQVTNVTIPQSVTTIGKNAFAGTHITKVMIPAATTEIGEGAFAGADRLEKIEVAEDNAAYKEQNGILYSEDGTKLIAVPAALSEVTIGEEVTEIADGAVSGNTTTIYGYPDSAARLYAMVNGILFIVVDPE